MKPTIEERSKFFKKNSSKIEKIVNDKFIDTIKKVVDDFHNNKGHFSKPKKDRKISPDVKNLLEKSSFEDKVAIIMDILDSDLSTPVQQDILLKYKDILLEIKKINKKKFIK